MLKLVFLLSYVGETNSLYLRLEEPGPNHLKSDCPLTVLQCRRQLGKHSARSAGNFPTKPKPVVCTRPRSQLSELRH